MNIPVSYVECPFESAWLYVSGGLLFSKGLSTVSLVQLYATFDSSWFGTWLLVPVEQHLLEQHPMMPDFVLKQLWTMLEEQLKIDGLQLCSGPYQNRRY
jgi:hypothetical protein